MEGITNGMIGPEKIEEISYEEFKGGVKSFIAEVIKEMVNLVKGAGTEGEKNLDEARKELSAPAGEGGEECFWDLIEQIFDFFPPIISEIKQKFLPIIKINRIMVRDAKVWVRKNGEKSAKFYRANNVFFWGPVEEDYLQLFRRLQEQITMGRRESYEGMYG